MIIGNLNKDLRGSIKTLECSFAIKLTENANKAKEKSPTHSVWAKNHFGDAFQIGSAWERKITKGAKENQNMYSLSIDDPAFKSPLNCSAFPSDEGFYITWERQTENVATEEF